MCVHLGWAGVDCVAQTGRHARRSSRARARAGCKADATGGMTTLASELAEKLVACAARPDFARFEAQQHFCPRLRVQIRPAFVRPLARAAAANDHLDCTRGGGP